MFPSQMSSVKVLRIGAEKWFNRKQHSDDDGHCALTSATRSTANLALASPHNQALTFSHGSCAWHSTLATSESKQVPKLEVSKYSAVERTLGNFRGQTLSLILLPVYVI